MAFKLVVAWNRTIRGLVNLVICLNQIHWIFFKILYFSIFIYLYTNDSPCNFSFTGKKSASTEIFFFPSTDIIMVALFSYSSFFFPQKGITFFFSFAHFLNQIVKPRHKTTFSKLLRKAFKIKNVSQIYTFKKRFYRLWQSSCYIRL